MMKNTRENQRFKPIMNDNQILKVFKDFCESTSLHGYGYLYSADFIFLKIVWITIILTMTALGIFFLAKHTREYLDSSILTTIETSSASLSVSTYTNTFTKKTQRKYISHKFLQSLYICTHTRDILNPRIFILKGNYMALNYNMQLESN